MIAPGVTTAEIDKAIFDFIKSAGAWPTFLHYNGFPNSSCISVNDEVIHGIPGRRRILEGDIVSLDIGATLDGFVGDWRDIPGRKGQRRGAPADGRHPTELFRGDPLRQSRQPHIGHFRSYPELCGKKRLFRGTGLCRTRCGR
jgi:hypothetical protein